MASTEFVDGTTRIVASWLNEVDDAVYGGAVNAERFGATGDGVTDDSDAIIAATALNRDVILNDGTFIVSKMISAINGQKISGQGKDKTIIKSSFVPSSSNEASLRTNSVEGGGFHDLELEATVGASQIGLLVAGTSPACSNLNILEFDYGMYIGNTLWSSSYYADVRGIRIQNNTFKGSVGVYIDGGGAHSSNSNILTVVQAKGLFDKLLLIKGHSNTLISCDFTGDKDSNMTSLMEFEGDGNILINPYSEVSGSGTLTNYILFVSGSSANLIMRPYAATGVTGFAPITDLGFGNDIQQATINNGNFIAIPSTQGYQNLHFNSYFQTWDTSRPKGYAAPVRGTYTQDSATVHSGEYSNKFVGDGTGVNNLSYRLAGASSSSKTQIAFYQGHTLNAGCWVYATTASLFQIKLASDGTGGTSYGSAVHTGGGWEYLTVSYKVPTDATYVSFAQYSVSNSDTAYFNSPMVNVGPVLAANVPSIDVTTF